MYFLANQSYQRSCCRGGADFGQKSQFAVTGFKITRKEKWLLVNC